MTLPRPCPIPAYPQDMDQSTLPPDPPVDSTPQDPMSDVSFNDCLHLLFSDHELARYPSSQLSPSDNPPEQSMVGTSAPLLTHPTLTDYLSNYPKWPNEAEDSNMCLSRPSSPSVDDAPLVAPETLTAPSSKRVRRRTRKKHGCLVNGKSRL